jgi:L-fuculose-phosphate aldolase
VRVPEGLIITPSKIAYDAMVPSDLVTVSKEGTILAGHRVPSSETELHRALLNERDDIEAIIHAHSPYASALSCLRRPIPPFVEDLVQIAGGQVNCTHYVHGGDHRGVAQEVVKAIGDGNAVLLANHGVVCCGRDLDEVFVTCQVVEKAALMMLAAASVGPMVPIPDEYVRSERYRFLHLYGTAEGSP